MADAPAAKKLEVPKLPEMVAPVQQSFKIDSALADKINQSGGSSGGVDSKNQVLVWYGTLPAVGPIATFKTDKLNNVIRGEDTTAISAWMHPERMSEWYGKCPWFQNISIRSITFPAFSGYSQRSGFESPTQAISFDITKAGAIGYFTEDQIKEILAECTLTRITPAKSPRAPHTAEIFRLLEEPPGSGKFIHPAQNPTISHRDSTKYFDPDRDKPVADYVYFIKIQNEFQQQDLLSIMKNPLPSLSGK